MGAVLEQGKSVRIPPSEEKGAAETMCDGLTTNPIFRPPALLRRGGREFRSEVKPGKKGEVGGKGFSFYFSLPYSALISKKSN